MFTGIIEGLGRVEAISLQESNQVLRIRASLGAYLSLGQSLAHNGACLTVEDIQEHTYQVTVISQTLAKTMFPTLKVGDEINLERALAVNARLDGHFVQGHVDTTGRIERIEAEGASKRLFISYPRNYVGLVVSQGSIALNGISLTIADTVSDGLPSPIFTVCIVPHTYENTNVSYWRTRDLINIEFDILAKYMERYLQKQRECVKKP